MKKYFNITILLMLVLFFEDSSAFEFQKPNPHKIMTEAIEKHNGSLDVDSFFNSIKADKEFLRDFKSYTDKLKIKKFVKADLIGETVYFKKNNQMISLQFVEAINSHQYNLKMNGKSITIDIRDGFAKTLGLMKSTLPENSVSFWNLIIPQANADDTIDDLEDRMASALSATAWFNSFFTEESMDRKQEVCALNAQEEKEYKPRFSTDEVLFKEIKYFIQLQEMYVKATPRSNIEERAGVCHVECTWANEFQACIMGLAERRKALIEKRDTHAFPCFKVQQAGRVYLYPNMALESYDSTLEEKERALRNCISKFSDSDRAECRRKLRREIASLKSMCPLADERTAGTSTPAGGPSSGRARANK